MMLDKVLPNFLNSACLGRRRTHFERTLRPCSSRRHGKHQLRDPPPMTSLFD